MYAITAAGRHAWESEDRAIPEQYRRFLWLIDVQGGARAFRRLSRDHEPTLLSDWLKELEELALLEFRSPGADAATIPLAIDEPPLEAAANAAASLAGMGVYLAIRPKERRAHTSGAPKTVLIVEDDPDQLALADLRLTMAGYRVRLASTVDALTSSLIQDGLPDLLLLDVMLPDGNGFEVLGKIRRHPQFGSLPIVLLTAKREPYDIGKGLALGADGYVVKPYSKNVIAGVILKVLDD